MNCFTVCLVAYIPLFIFLLVDLISTSGIPVSHNILQVTISTTDLTHLFRHKYTCTHVYMWVYNIDSKTQLNDHPRKYEKHDITTSPFR